MYIDTDNLYREIVISKNIGSLTIGAKNILNLLGENIINKYSYHTMMKYCFMSGMHNIFLHWYHFNDTKYDNPYLYFVELFKRGMTSKMTMYVFFQNIKNELLLVSDTKYSEIDDKYYYKCFTIYFNFDTLCIEVQNNINMSVDYYNEQVITTIDKFISDLSQKHRSLLYNNFIQNLV